MTDDKELLGNLTSDKELGIVVYTDGSAKPNPGFTGSGMHGYIYDMNHDGPFTKNKIPSGYTITDTEYDVLRSKKNNVEPLYYIDGYTSLITGTSNTAELHGVINMLKKIKNKSFIKRIFFNLDSIYVLNIINKIISNTYRYDNNTANIEIILELKSLIETIRSENRVIKVSKVKAHIGILGNELADQLALLGRLRATRNYEENFIYISNPRNYWTNKYSSDLLNYTYLYFEPEDPEDEYGILEYKLTPKKKTPFEKLGEPDKGAMHGFIKLREEIPILKDLVRLFKSQNNIEQGLNYINLKFLFSPEVSRYYKLFGSNIFTVCNDGNNTISFLEKAKLIGLVVPRGMATFTKRKIEKYKTIIEINESRSGEEKELAELSFVNLLEHFFDENNKAKTKQEKAFLIEHNGLKFTLKSNKELFTMGKLKTLLKEGEATLIMEKRGAMYVYYIYYRFKDGSILLTTPYSNRVIPIK